LFIHSPEAADNLRREGIAADKIHMVGNTMIDTLVTMSPHIDALDVAGQMGLPSDGYLVVTLHRPALVDGPLLADAFEALAEVARHLPVVFPVHPRTRQALAAARIEVAEPDRLRLLEPIGYLQFLSLVKGSAAVLTDSGGIQEETTFLGIPCFTLRDNTERPVTCTVGTNTLLGLEPERITEIPALLAAGGERHRGIPEGWDGAAARRIVDVLARTSLSAAQPAIL
jgi:UDP-N-acetylglucosamine 2-epimerase (non-hydrolysing)